MTPTLRPEPARIRPASLHPPRLEQAVGQKRPDKEREISHRLAIAWIRGNAKRW